MKWFCFILITSLVACSGTDKESLISGSTTFLVESSDSVAIAQQWDIFSNDYPEAKINLKYLPQNYALQQFLDDKARVLVCDRNLTLEEKNTVERDGIKLRSYLISAKSIAIIAHPSNTITSLKQDELKLFIQGNLPLTKEYSLLVSDGNSAIYAYLKGKFGDPKLKQAGSINALMNTISSNPKAIGFIPTDYLIDETSNRKRKNLNRIKAIPIRSNQDQKLYSAATPNMKGLKYPLVQEIYLHDAQGKSGLGTGFAGFMLSDRGQLIFKKMGWYAVRNRERDIQISL